MSEALKERKEMDPQYQWDLTQMYASDAEWEKAFAAIDPKIEALAAWEGKLNNAASIREFYDAEIGVFRELENLAVYTSLRLSEDTRADDAQSMDARATAKYVKAVGTIAYAQPEILALPQETLDAIMADEQVAPYRFALEDLLRAKPHTLTAPEEKLLAAFGEAFGTPKNVADNLEDADMVFDSVKDGEGNDVELTASNYILLQTSNDRVLRKNAFESYYKSFRQHINTLAASYSGAVKTAAAEASVRHYESSRAMSMAGENVPGQVYDNLVATVRKHLPDMYRYVALRKRILGVDELHYYDVYAPLTKGVSAHYTYDQAKQMVLDAVAPLGEEYGTIVRKGFAERWIDVFPNKGKSGGAYSGGSYDSNPYIMCNFTGTLDSVSTIAHEMGHSMHSWFSRHTQPAQYADYTLFVAEVASTVNENLLIEHLLAEKNQNPATRLALLNQYLENFKGTVYRQTMFAEFERDAHAMAERGEALNPAALNHLYKKLIVDYFGPELVVDDEVQYEWARIPHFYRPFYVYKYATGYSTAVALSEGILKNGEPAVKKYLEFLHMGGSAYPLDELRHAGVDLTTPAPVDAALDKFGRILDEAEACVAQLEAAK
ncbi:MAG: oligoendopeptidase F [Subdoligranulum sp.]